MFKEFWAKNKKYIFIALLVYAGFTLLIVLGSSNSQDMAFNYQIR
jgi:uncharacterized membrane protein YciS (DUF1049 family)